MLIGRQAGAKRVQGRNGPDADENDTLSIVEGGKINDLGVIAGAADGALCGQRNFAPNSINDLVGA